MVNCKEQRALQKLSQACRYTFRPSQTLKPSNTHQQLYKWKHKLYCSIFLLLLRTRVQKQKKHLILFNLERLECRLFRLTTTTQNLAGARVVVVVIPRCPHPHALKPRQGPQGPEGSQCPQRLDSRQLRVAQRVRHKAHQGHLGNERDGDRQGER